MHPEVRRQPDRAEALLSRQRRLGSQTVEFLKFPLAFISMCSPSRRCQAI
ncbi:MAG: hypothetical protein JJT89_12725 [Nitriliruptoraceae bacterium]|nr:hypothetical protein [Nitriliruptoraceae bacterium]